MNMILAIDIGNSSTNFGLFEGDKLKKRWDFETKDTLSESQFIEITKYSVEGCSISSVVPEKTATVTSLVKQHCATDPLLVSPDLNLGMQLHYDDLSKLGTDRIADAVAAKKHYKTPVVVIDFGTATVCNVINTEGDFIGGAIAPGIQTAKNALIESAAQLPDVMLEMPERAIATNTTSGLQAGILYMTIGFVREMLDSIQAELDERMFVVATGGLARDIAPYIDAIDQVNTNLTLEGLYTIYTINKNL